MVVWLLWLSGRSALAAQARGVLGLTAWALVTLIHHGSLGLTDALSLLHSGFFTPDMPNNKQESSLRTRPSLAEPSAIKSSTESQNYYSYERSCILEPEYFQKLIPYSLVIPDSRQDKTDCIVLPHSPSLYSTDSLDIN